MKCEAGDFLLHGIYLHEDRAIVLFVLKPDGEVKYISDFVFDEQEK